MGLKPEFSARANGTASIASANARIAYCSIPGLYSRKVSLGHIRVKESHIKPHLHSSILDGKGAGNFSGTSTVHNSIVTHQVADDTKGIV